MRLPVLAVLSLAALSVPALAAEPITIVAAENVYGGLAQEIAGPHARVLSILSNPDQDPHLFEASATTARAIADARVVIANGADYDPWMDKLLAASKGEGRTEIVVADLVGRKPGDNPHLWYDPATMQALATRVADTLGKIDPAHRTDFVDNAKRFTEQLAPLQAKVAEIKTRHGGEPVTASEPVFGYMAQALGLTMRNERFQTAVMNDTEPSPADVAAFETDLRTHKVRVMITNSQASDAAVTRLVGIAEASGVPVVGVTETEPAGTTYVGWMMSELTALDKALANGPRS